VKMVRTARRSGFVSAIVWVILPTLVVLCAGHIGDAYSAGSETAPAQLTVLYTGNLAGRLEALAAVGEHRSRIQREIGRVLLVDTGGAMLRAESAFDHPGGSESLTVDVLNGLRYDAWTLGRSELNRPAAELSAALREARFPVLSANLYQPDTGRHLFQVQPFAVLQSAGLRIGLLGLSAGGKTTAAAEPARAADYFVPLLRKRCDVVCVLSSLGFQADSLLASRVNGIDVIVGARRDTAISTPVRINGAALVAAGGTAPEMGRIDLTLGADGKVATATGSRIPLGRAAEATAQGFLKGWTAPLDGETLPLTTAIGTAGEGLDRGAASGPALGNLVADLIREAASAEIGFVASTSLNPSVAAGPLGLLDLYRAYEWPLHLEVLTVRGKQVRAFLEGTLDTPGIAFYPSGLEVVYDFSRAEGDRVVMAKAGGALLNNDRVYRVVVEDGLVGEDGAGPGLGDLLETESRTQTGILVRDLVGRHVREAGKLEGREDGRVQQR
jgi:5'-nucleotidase